MGGNSKSSRKEKHTGSPFIKTAVAAAAASVLYFILLAAFSAFALSSGLSESFYMTAGMVTGALTAFSGGFIAVRPIKEKGALYGLVTGGIQALVCSAVLFIVNNATAGNGIFILSALIVASAVLGGISAVNLKIKKKY